MAASFAGRGGGCPLGCSTVSLLLQGLSHGRLKISSFFDGDVHSQCLVGRAQMAASGSHVMSLMREICSVGHFAFIQLVPIVLCFSPPRPEPLIDLIFLSSHENCPSSDADPEGGDYA